MDTRHPLPPSCPVCRARLIAKAWRLTWRTTASELATWGRWGPLLAFVGVLGAPVAMWMRLRREATVAAHLGHPHRWAVQELAASVAPFAGAPDVERIADAVGGNLLALLDRVLRALAGWLGTDVAATPAFRAAVADALRALDAVGGSPVLYNLRPAAERRLTLTLADGIVLARLPERMVETYRDATTADVAGLLRGYLTRCEAPAA